jgi:hypothetical protein
MATPPDRPGLRPATVLRVAALFDIVGGVAVALFGNRVVPLGDIVPGLPVVAVVGGLFALFGVGTLVVAAWLDRRRD